MPARGLRGREVPPSWEEWNEALHGTGKHVLEQAGDFVAARHPRLELDLLPAEGDPAWVLREQSGEATAVVLDMTHVQMVIRLGHGPEGAASPRRAVSDLLDVL
ncbi:hypothetical protein ACQ4WX_47440 [Streptomyces lasalocidi]